MVAGGGEDLRLKKIWYSPYISPTQRTIGCRISMIG